MENKTHLIRTEYCVTGVPVFDITHLHELYNSDIFISGMGGPPGQGYPPAYPPAQRPPGHEGYGGPPGTPGAPGYNNYPGQGGPPPAWRGQYDQNTGPPTTGNDMYNRGWRGSGGYPPTSQPFDQ